MATGFTPYARHCELESRYAQSIKCLEKTHKKDVEYCKELIATALNDMRAKQYLDAVALLSGKVVRVFQRKAKTFETLRGTRVDNGGATTCFVLTGNHCGGFKRHDITPDTRIFVETNF